MTGVGSPCDLQLMTPVSPSFLVISSKNDISGLTGKTKNRQFEEIENTDNNIIDWMTII